LVTPYDIVALPADVPYTTPVEDTVATPVELLLHEPPVVASARVEVPPIDVDKVPVIDAGAAGTVVTVITVLVDDVPQRLDAVYTIVSVPAPTPVTTPVPIFTVAIDGKLVVQLPPDAVSVRVIELLTHTVVAPDIALTAGAPFTVTVVVAVAVPHEVLNE
jgi:hypothetical protein